MPNIRGECKQDIQRAELLAKHIQERLAWIVGEYKDHPEFAGSVEAVLLAGVEVEKALHDILQRVP